MNNLTPEHVHILQHSLGISQTGSVYRNRFVAGEGHDEMSLIKDLVEAGLMEERTPKGFLEQGDRLFVVTESGKDYCNKPEVKTENYKQEESMSKVKSNCTECNCSENKPDEQWRQRADRVYRLYTVCNDAAILNMDIAAFPEPPAILQDVSAQLDTLERSDLLEGVCERPDRFLKQYETLRDLEKQYKAVKENVDFQYIREQVEAVETTIRLLPEGALVQDLDDYQADILDRHIEIEYPSTENGLDPKDILLPYQDWVKHLHKLKNHIREVETKLKDLIQEEVI